VRRILELLFGSDDRRGSYRPLFEAIGIKEELRDVIDIKHNRIHSGNYLKYLIEFTNARFYTIYKDNVYIVYQKDGRINTIVFNQNELRIIDVIKDKAIVVTHDGLKFEIDTRELNCENIYLDSIQVNMLNYYIVVCGRKVYFMTNYSLELKEFNIPEKDIDKISNVSLTTDGEHVFILVKGVKKGKHICSYYTIGRFYLLLCKILDEYGEVRVSGSLIPKQET